MSARRPNDKFVKFYLKMYEKGKKNNGYAHLDFPSAISMKAGILRVNDNAWDTTMVADIYKQAAEYEKWFNKSAIRMGYRFSVRQNGNRGYVFKVEDLERAGGIETIDLLDI